MSVPAAAEASAPTRAARTRRTRPGRPVLIIALVVVLLLVLAFTVFRLTSSGGPAVGPVTIPLEGRTAGLVQIDSGADEIVVSVADLGTDLAVVSTPGGVDGGVRPRAQLDGNQLRVWTEDVGDPKTGGQVRIEVTIAQGVRWDVVVAKGARQIQLGLGTGLVSSLELRGGADQVDVTLPKPTGEQVVRIPTGLATATFHVPAGVPSRVTFAAGAGQVNVDGAQQLGIEPDTTIYGVSGQENTQGEKGFEAAEDRLAIDVTAGVGAINLDRRTS